MLILPRLFLLTMVLFFSLTLWVNPAQASIKLNDQFKATAACEAFQSIRKGTNPGNIRLTPDRIYPVTAKNKEDATHYYLKIDGADPSSRWVSTNCGELLETPIPQPPDSQNTDNLLAISWQPAFCETRPSKPECVTQTEDRFDASNFTLHGLWPQPRDNIYCGVSQENERLDRAKRWFELPDIELSDELKSELAIKMPGVESGLHLHEWYKHGTCYSATPEEYYRESLDLLDQVNNSVVQTLFVENIERNIMASDIRGKFDRAFSNEAGDKVSIQCKRDNEPTNRKMITELKLNLKGNIESDTLVADLFKNGKTVAKGCSIGEVDRAGLD